MSFRYSIRAQKATGCVLLARALREARAWSGYTQPQLVEKCQTLQNRMVPVPRQMITRARLAQWENAHRQIRINDLAVIKDALGVEISGIGATYRSKHHVGYYARANVYDVVEVTCRSTESVVWTSNASQKHPTEVTGDEGTANPPTI